MNILTPVNALSCSFSPFSYEMTPDINQHNMYFTYQTADAINTLTSLQQNLVEYLGLQPANQRLEKKLRRVEQAFIRMVQGNWGLCMECNNPIKQNRLKQLPYAEMCLACQRRLE